jgi:hypothetical protein
VPGRPFPPGSAYIKAYSHKSVSFKFRGSEFVFALSQGLFSSAGMDTGTLLLFKVFSHKIDEALTEGRSLPRSILDAGSGTGVLGVCAARALGAVPAGWDGRVRAQDRDELARVFTLYNAALNGVPSASLTACTEPLLAGPPEGGWDLILSNVPAKTGKPVLLDFISRSAASLGPGGRVMIVVVNPLASLFRARIAGLGLPLLYEEPDREHTVFVYGRNDRSEGREPVLDLDGSNRDTFLLKWPAYLRGSADYTLEGVSYRIDAFHGVADFDTPGGAVQTAVKLLGRLEGWGGDIGASISGRPPGGLPMPILVFEPDQGHFPVWLASSRASKRQASLPAGNWVFSGRNILSLEAARYNTLRVLKTDESAGGCGTAITLLPAVDPDLDQMALAARGPYGFIAFFPDAVPLVMDTERMDAWWAALASLLPPGGFLLAALSASGMERFDRRKSQGFTRRGDVRRMGFRARLYERIRNG